MVADVPDPILGADFLHEFNLSPHLRASLLVDHTTHLSVPCLQKTSVLRRISTVPHSIPDRFSSILRRLPNLTKPLSASTSPKHHVVSPLYSHQRLSLSQSPSQTTFGKAKGRPSRIQTHDATWHHKAVGTKCLGIPSPSCVETFGRLASMWRFQSPKFNNAS